MPADGVGDRTEITFRYSQGETRSLEAPTAESMWSLLGDGEGRSDPCPKHWIFVLQECHTCSSVPPQF